MAAIAAAAMMAMPAFAKTTKEYQRPSLHMVVMTTKSNPDGGNATTQIADPELLGYAAEAWGTYEFPALYNDFRVPFGSVEVGTVKGSIMDLLAEYQDPAKLQNMGIAELKEIIEMMQGKKYRRDLAKEVEKVQGEVAHQLLAKWFGIQQDGSWDQNMGTLTTLACYSATQNAAAEAAQTGNGAAELVNQLMEPTIANTYVTFSKLDFYENEPIATFIKNIMMIVAEMTPAPLNLGVQIGAEEAYKASREGYTAFVNALLYKLDWNPEIAEQFWACFKEDGTVDMDKFNALDLKLTYVGATGSSATCMMKKGDSGKGAEHMVNKTVYKALNRQFADLRRAYEEFRPMMPILEVNAKGGILADMGTKEGVTEKDQFTVLEPVVNEKGQMKYVYKGIVKVDKKAGGVWKNDDIDNATAATLNEGETEMQGTHLTALKGATNSMFVKMGKK